MVRRGRSRGLAGFVEVTAGAAVARGVLERPGIAEFALAQLDGAGAHGQHKAAAVVVQPVVGRGSQRGVDVSEGHACGDSLFP